MTMEPASTRANRVNSDSLDWSYIEISFAVGCSSRGVRGGLRRPGRVHLRGARQRLRVNIFPDVRHFATANGNVEDPIVLERLIRGFDFPRSDADDQNPVSLRHEFGELWVCRLQLFGRLLKNSRQFRMPAVPTGQRPALARNHPLNVFSSQRQQTLLIATAHCCKKILHNLDILLCAHRNLSTCVTIEIIPRLEQGKE